MERQGINVMMAVLLLAGQMAGVGVINLPNSMIGTGPAGFFLIIYFTINAIFVGQRLGLCWIMVERMFPEYRHEVRDPYMVIAEKASGRVGRYLVSTCICITLYGFGCLVLVLCGNFFQNIFEFFGSNLSTCIWTIIVTAILTPLCWLGSPKDFWGAAAGALAATVIACVMIMIKEVMDIQNSDSCYHGLTPSHPEPKSIMDFGQAFSSIMFAFAGASTFPTIQADMKDRSKFPRAAVFAMIILCAVYLPMSVVGWWFLGDQVKSSVVDSLCDGPAKVMIQFLFLLHLLSALPIILSPPFQFCEELIRIPKKFGLQRVVFRTIMMGLLLVIGLSLPNFGAILNLIGATTITLLNFIFPPIFYLLLERKYKIVQNISTQQDTQSTKSEEFEDPSIDIQPVSLCIKIYCWHLVVVCSIGGLVAFISSIRDIQNAFKDGQSCWSSL